MRRYILTGTPGAGKTSILRALHARGLSVVEEAATDVIALEHAHGVTEPHTDPGFIDRIVRLQTQRRLEADVVGAGVQFHDRSPICTHALNLYLGFPLSTALMAEIDRIRRDGVYQTRVFFIETLGFVEPTAARRISFEQALTFQAVHERSYREFGYELVRIAPASVEERVEAVLATVRNSPIPSGQTNIRLSPRRRGPMQLGE